MPTTKKKPKKTASPPAASSPTDSTESTVRWGKVAESPGNWIKVPRVVFTRFDLLKDRKVTPQHLLLLLLLQTKKFQKRPTRLYWQEVANALGYSRETVRRWGYELQEIGLLDIKQNRAISEDDFAAPGYRNERNTFNTRCFADAVDDLIVKDRSEREARKKKSRRTGATS